MNDKEAKKIYERIISLKKFLFSEKSKTNNNTYDLCLKNVDKFIDDIIEYNKCIYLVESRSLFKNIYIDEDYIDTIENNDYKRKDYHNKIILDLRVLDTLCDRLKIEPIYGKLGDYLKDVSLLLDGYSKDSVIIREDISNFAVQFLAFIILDRIENDKGFITSINDYKVNVA